MSAGHSGDGDKTPSSPILTIVVSIFNTSKYLHHTLDSIRSQDFSALEVICIDDGSTDGSDKIIREFVENDSRFKAIIHRDNCGTHLTRIEGMELASGKYVWLIDGDDSIAPDACTKLSKLINRGKTDVIHVGTHVINENYLNQDRIDYMQRFTKPFKRKLLGEDVFKGCFIDDKYKFNIWNKVFSKDVLLKSIPDFKKDVFPKAQDKYEYYVIASHADSYSGHPDLVAYEYHFGNGTTGHSKITRESFSKYCSMSKASRAIEDYSEGKSKMYADAAAISRQHLIADCVANWYRLPIDDRSDAFDEMIDSWGPLDIIPVLAKRNWFSQEIIAKSISSSRFFHKPCSNPKVIATYYHRLNNGGVQRVISSLTDIWVSMGYEVVLITDEEPKADDYPLNPKVRRELIPDYSKISRDTYSKRAIVLKRILEENHVDIVINHAWVVNTLLWDMMVCKTIGVSFVTNCHNVFAMLEGRGFTSFSSLPYIYGLMDGVVTLSEVDYRFWSHFNGNVHLVHNPMTFNPSACPVANLESQNVLWVGRFAHEKRPEDAIKIFIEVHKRNPESKLIMVGTGSTNQTDKLKKMVSNEGLSDFVEFKGFVREVSDYYLSSSVFIATSEFEGYFISLVESLTFGVPAVVYDLPYLSVIRQRSGIITVEQKDIESAADEVCVLLNDYNYRKEIGHDGRIFAKQLYDIDISENWQRILTSVTSVNESPTGADELLMWDVLFDFYRNGINRKNNEINNLKNSLFYRLGHKVKAATHIFRKQR